MAASCRTLQAVEQDRIAERGGLDAYDVARLLALSDGIFAIAMTLLVLDLPVPQLVRAGNADLLSALDGLRANFASFVLSFSIVGLNWLNHHRLFRGVARIDPRLMQLNLVQLLLICFVPFTAALLSRYGDLTTAVALYAGNVCLMGVVSAITRVHLKRADLLDHDPGPAQFRLALAGSLASSAVFAVSIAVAVWSPTVAEFVWIALIPLRFVVNRFAWIERHAASLWPGKE